MKKQTLDRNLTIYALHLMNINGGLLAGESCRKLSEKFYMSPSSIQGVINTMRERERLLTREVI